MLGSVDNSDENRTPDNMWPGASVSCRTLELVCHQHKGRLIFSTPAEYESLGRTGRPRWRGHFSVTVDGMAGSWLPAISSELTDGPQHREAINKVLSQGSAPPTVH